MWTKHKHHAFHLETKESGNSVLQYKTLTLNVLLRKPQPDEQYMNNSPTE